MSTTTATGVVGARRRARRRPHARLIIGGTIVGLTVLAALVAPFIAPHDPVVQEEVNRILPSKVFNLSITKPEIIEDTHRRMKEAYHPDGGPWRRGAVAVRALADHAAFEQTAPPRIYSRRIAEKLLIHGLSEAGVGRFKDVGIHDVHHPDG